MIELDKAYYTVTVVLNVRVMQILTAKEMNYYPENNKNYKRSPRCISRQGRCLKNIIHEHQVGSLHEINRKLYDDKSKLICNLFN